MTSGRDPRDREVFAEFHRADDRRRAISVFVGVAVAAAAIAGLVATGLGTSPAVASAASGRDDAVLATVRSTVGVSTPSPTPTATSAARSAAPPPIPTAIATAAPAAAYPAGPASYTITITATGYQTELDQCQWVRMDLVPNLPIVGAHTGCGGRIVLSMNAGDRVTLSGQGLDGSYLVGDGRDAHAGDLAVAATAGMVGTVVLQTCYPGGTGRERLVALIPAS